MTGCLWVVLPLACLAGGALVIYLLTRFVPLGAPAFRNGALAAFTSLVFAAALVAFLPLLPGTAAAPRQLPGWGHANPGSVVLRADPGALVIVAVSLGLGAIVAFYSGQYLTRDRRYGLYYPLLLLLVTGLAGMVLSVDLFTLYLFCELMSIAAYALVAFRRHTDTAIEAGFKYLIMGTLGTVVLLMGISFIYRDGGDLAISSERALAPRYPGPWTRAGLACILVGLAVKSAIVPLHTWLPDAHGRAPSSVSAMLSGIVIQSAFYVLLKVSLGLGFPARRLGALLIALSLLNMTLGNLMALRQTNTKRLLAYSTIAQMGYVMFAVGIGLHYGIAGAIQAGFFLLVAHAAMKGLAFLCKGVCHFYRDATVVNQLRGTAHYLPLVAVAFGVALAGLAGIPPLAGFAGKWFILTPTWGAAGMYLGGIVFLLNGLVALGYYLPLIGALYAPLPPLDVQWHGGRIRMSPWMAIPIVTLGGLVLAIGLYPGPWMSWMAGIGEYLLAIGT